MFTLEMTLTCDFLCHVEQFRELLSKPEHPYE